MGRILQSRHRHAAARRWEHFAARAGRPDASAPARRAGTDLQSAQVLRGVRRRRPARSTKDACCCWARTHPTAPGARAGAAARQGHCGARPEDCRGRICCKIGRRVSFFIVTLWHRLTHRDNRTRGARRVARPGSRSPRARCEPAPAGAGRRRGAGNQIAAAPSGRAAGWWSPAPARSEAVYGAAVARALREKVRAALFRRARKQQSVWRCSNAGMEASGGSWRWCRARERSLPAPPKAASMRCSPARVVLITTRTRPPPREVIRPASSPRHGTLVNNVARAQLQRFARPTKTVPSRRDQGRAARSARLDNSEIRACRGAADLAPIKGVARPPPPMDQRSARAALQRPHRARGAPRACPQDRTLRCRSRWRVTT
jgi:hypothetical protein